MCDHIGWWSQQCHGHIKLKIKLNKMKKFGIFFLFFFLFSLLPKDGVSQPAQSRNLSSIRGIADNDISDIESDIPKVKIYKFMK